MLVSALVLHKDDKVATAVRPLQAGENIEVGVDDKTLRVLLLQSVPFGHKFAIKNIGQGDRIIKYGETIGLATAKISTGEHVHLHNVEGLRGRGDRQ